MRNSIVLSLSALVLLLGPQSAIAQPVQSCEVIGEYIPAETEYLYAEPDSGYVDAAIGSRVNIRSGPGTRFEISATAESGAYVSVLGQAFDADCDTWAKVKLPVSGVEGWIRVDLIELTFGRGWWT